MSEVAEKVKSIIAEHLGIDDIEKITNDAKFIDDLGADSLDTVELVMAFEEAFNLLKISETFVPPKPKEFEST